MSTHLTSSRGDTDPSRQLLARLLDAPHLERLVPHLAPETLHQLIRHNGLEACGDLVASATPEQITALFDLDLWRHSRPGRDDQFDVARFGEWLALLSDMDPAAAAHTVAAIDAPLFVSGLSQYIRVFDPGTFLPSFSTDDEPMEFDRRRAEDDQREIGGYVVRATDRSAWDAIVSLLVTLDAEQPDCFHIVMQGCRALSNSAPEVDGLDDLFTAPEQVVHDVALEREIRRAQHGYSTPADARAFLQMARERPIPTQWPAATSVLAAVYFRDADHQQPSPTPSEPKASTSRRAMGTAAHAPTPDDLDTIVRLLAEAGMVPERPRALLESGDSERSRVACLQAQIEYARDHDDDRYVKRSRELAFLANTLVAGGSILGRAFTPQEASDAAVSVSNLGLELWSAREPLPESFLIDHDLVTAFEIGWATLHHDVSLYVAGQLIEVLADLGRVDAETQRELRRLRRELATQHAAGTPWRAAEALDVISTLDTPAWASLVGLMSECPVLPAVLTATLARRPGAISPTAFEFIATAGQIAQVRAFMTRLPALLRG